MLVRSCRSGCDARSRVSLVIAAIVLSVASTSALAQDTTGVGAINGVVVNAAGVTGGARVGVEGAHAHAACRLAGRVQHDAPDGAHAGGVLGLGSCRREAQDGGRDHE